MSMNIVHLDMAVQRKNKKNMRTKINKSVTHKSLKKRFT